MRGVLIGFGCVAALIAATFLPQVQDYRDEKADAHFVQGDLKSAKRFYFYGKLQGNKDAANNYHVINYRMARFDKGMSPKRFNATRRKTFRAFDKLTQEGHVLAAYNAGMFYYRSKAGSSDYNKGLVYFNHAAASGDEMSRHAADFMRARAHTKEKKSRELRKSADAGNGWAAYRYVEDLRFDKTKLRRAQKYAVMGAEAGYADAQQFLGAHFPHHKDARSWLEKAATNPNDPSLLAAFDLALLADKDKDYAAKRRWLTLGSTPREPFRYRLISEPDGLRWRGLQSSILADANNSKKAAYELALMQLEGLGGTVNFAAAKASLEYAEDWSDAPELLNQVKSGAVKLKGHRRADKDGSNFDLEWYDNRKYYPFHGKLRPYMVSKQIRYATQKDLDKYAQGVSTSYSNEKQGFRERGSVDSCALGSTCFYIEKSIILPPGMNGANSAQFLINPALYLPKQEPSHNKYIFLNERYVP